MHYRVKKVVVGDLDTNCYIIKQDDTRNAVVIDPGDDAILIKSELHEMDAFPAVILLTHGHFDHILALDELRTEKTVVCIHKDDAHKLKEKELIAAWAKSNPWPFKDADVVFGEKDRHVNVGGLFVIFSGICCLREIPYLKTVWAEWILKGAMQIKWLLPCVCLAICPETMPFTPVTTEKLPYPRKNYTILT